jgi:hypothetical protein
MTKYLYADNFRGFSDTYIPLAEVNFLVGENSTGKTSVLDLLRTLSNPALLFGPAPFGAQEVHIGLFKEIVSVHADDRTYFRIGLIEEGPPAPNAMLLTYKEHTGLPQISQFTCALGGKAVTLKFEGPKLYAKVNDIAAIQDVNGMRTLMQEWVADQSEQVSDWREVAPPSGLSNLSWSRTPLFIIMTLVSQALLGQAEENPPNAAPFVLPPRFGSGLVWIGPIRTRARRTYDAPSTAFSSAGLHTPYIIRRMLGSADEAKKFSEFMGRVGKASGLFQAITMRAFGDPDDPTSPFEVDAVLDEKVLNLSWMGYGVSQSLPIFVELLDRPVGSWFAIQQPEVHLHPRAQASLGDVFFEMSTRDHKCFVIETHSDFTIDRFRLNYRRKTAHKPSSQVLFFERRNKRNTVTAVPIAANGELPSSQPDSYRRFFLKEEMRLLGI